MALDTQTNLDKEINEGILRTYLGIDDPTDIDFDTYRTLLKEKIAAARMAGPAIMDSGDISYLTNEYSRIKKIQVPEGQKKKKIDINKLVKKAEEKKKADTKSAQKLFNVSPKEVSNTKKPSVNSQKLLPPAPDLDESQNIDSDFAQSIRNEFDSKLDDLIDDVQNIADDFDRRLDDLLEDIRNDKDEKQAVIDDLKSENDEQKKALNMLAPSFASMEENLEEILGNTREQTKLREDAVKQADKIEQTTERKDREAKLESKSSKLGDTVKKAEKATKPMGGFLDMILNFFKNILLGGALVALMNIIENPGKMLNPIIKNINGFIDFINNVLEKIFTVLLFIPNRMIDNFNFGIGFITDRINDAINLFGGDPIDKFQVPNLEPPQIPKIPLLEEGGSEGGGSEMPAAGAQGGGMVPAMQEGGLVYSPVFNMGTPRFNSGGIVVKPNINPQTVNDFSYASGGSITSNSGQRISGMGADTQLIAAQPGEMVMSKSAVNYWGAGNLLAMNKQGGGTNKPKMGKVRGFSGGGYINDVKAHDNTQGPNENKKIYLHWNGGANTSTGPYGNFGYHTMFPANGKPARGYKYGSSWPYHTYGRNKPNAAGLAVSGNLYATPDETKSWGKYQVANNQYKAMAKEAAALATLWGWKPSDINSSRVLTHWELATIDKYPGGPYEKWDLERLQPGDPRGSGPSKMRNMIKSFMGMMKGDSPVDDKPYFEAAGGFYSKETQGFLGSTEEEAMIKTSKSDMLTGPGPAGASYSASPSSPPPTSSTPSSSAGRVSSPSKPSIPGAPTAGGTNVRLLPLGGGGKQQSASASNAGQTRVDGFSPIDLNNPELIVIKSIYNVVG